MTTINDQKYIERVLKGDKNAFANLVNKYKNMVFGLAFKMIKNREEAEEISQDAFIKAYKSLPKFKGESKFSTWLYKITYHAALDKLKKVQKEYNIDSIDEVTLHRIKSTDTILEEMERKERAKVIEGCLNQLPEEERTILWLFYFQELSLKEIMQIVSLSESNVKVKLHRARKRLLTVVQSRVEPELIENYGRK